MNWDSFVTPRREKARSGTPESIALPAKINPYAIDVVDAYLAGSTTFGGLG